MIEANDDDELISKITPDVMRCLEECSYFENLDDILCPRDDSAPTQRCGGAFAISEMILSAAGFDCEALADVFGVLRSKRGFCDCEVLFNVAKESRMAAKYWCQQAEEFAARKIAGFHRPDLES